MPTILTIPLTTTEPLFFDEAWPLEQLFLETLAKGQGPAAYPNGKLKPYTLSPIWREEKQRGVPVSEKSDGVAYRWRVCLLDDALVPQFGGLEATNTLSLGGKTLTIGKVKVKEWRYERLAQQAHKQAQVKPKARRYFDLEFVTPVVLQRSGVPMPLPDPVLVFHHYLLAWDTFAPREWWVNINILDAIEVHLALIEHQLETRTVKPDGKRSKTGFLGQVTYKMMAWEKLGAEFLGTLQMLAHFAEFCGTGALTECGLGQTRLRHNKQVR